MLWLTRRHVDAFIERRGAMPAEGRGLPASRARVEAIQALLAHRDPDDVRRTHHTTVPPLPFRARVFVYRCQQQYRAWDRERTLAESNC